MKVYFPIEYTNNEWNDESCFLHTKEAWTRDIVDIRFHFVRQTRGE